jgi:hypothetical protein
MIIGGLRGSFMTKPTAITISAVDSEPGEKVNLGP